MPTFRGMSAGGDNFGQTDCDIGAWTMTVSAVTVLFVADPLEARWRRHFAEHPETPRKPRRAQLPHDEVHERRAASHRKPVVGISAQTGERHRFDSLLAAAEFLFAQGATTSVVAAQLIISQVCNGHRRTGFGYYWEFPHRGRPMTLETRKKRA